MTLALTPRMLEAAYDFLRTTAPFYRWKLPPGDQIEFRVARTKMWVGLFDRQSRQHPRISISNNWHGYMGHLLETMAHEMIHLYQARTKTRDGAEHGPRFKRLASRVCRIHGFDPKGF